MLKKRLMSLGIAAVFTLSSLTTTVFAADYSKAAASAKVTVKITNPGKGNGNSKNKDKTKEKKYRFDDCLDISWALNAIEKMAGKGILGGIGQNKFAPKNNVTHVEALAMVLRLTGDSKEADSLGKKVHPYYNGIMPLWGYGYIYIAIEKGILLPEELKDFNPNKPAKRHEIAKYIIRAMGDTEEALEHMDEDLPFKDSSAVPKKSVGYVYLVNELNIMTGNNNMFKPNDPVTRAEMAVLLERAEGRFELPDTDNRKNGIVFVSADEDDNEITVKVKGNTVTYDVLNGVQVYRDGAFEDIEDLEAGDVLQLTLNDSKVVIFIEVVKDAGDNDDEEETEVSFSTVSYNSLPQVLKSEVDELKVSENYKAYEYNGYIYLLAAMGKKNTGGYDIDIEKVYRVETDDDEYTIKALVDTDKPSSGAFVTQVVTYPYSIVRFKSFDGIENVVFLDEDDNELKDTDIEDIDEAAVIEGEIYRLSSSSRTIKIEKANGSKVSYTVPSSAQITVNGDNAKFSDLEVGMSIEIEITGDKVTKVTAEDNKENEVSFEAVDYSDLPGRLKDQADYLKLSKNYKAYEYDGYVYLIASMGKRNTGGYEIEIDELYKLKSSGKYIIKAVVETDSPSSGSVTTQAVTYPYSVVRFKNFDNISAIRFVDVNNNKLSEVKIIDLDEAVTVEGKITAISTKSNTIKVTKSNGSVVTLTIPDDAEITVNDDDDESLSDLETGMTVKIEMVDDRVTKVVAEDSLTEVKGTLTAISISTEKRITLKVGNSNKTYTVGSDVKVVIDGETERVEDLRVNDKLTLKFENGKLYEIEKE